MRRPSRIEEWWWVSVLHASEALPLNSGFGFQKGIGYRLQNNVLSQTVKDKLISPQRRINREPEDFPARIVFNSPPNRAHLSAGKLWPRASCHAAQPVRARLLSIIKQPSSEIETPRGVPWPARTRRYLLEKGFRVVRPVQDAKALTLAYRSPICSPWEALGATRHAATRAACGRFGGSASSGFGPAARHINSGPCPNPTDRTTLKPRATHTRMRPIVYVLNTSSHGLRAMHGRAWRRTLTTPAAE